MGGGRNLRKNFMYTFHRKMNEILNFENIRSDKSFINNLLNWMNTRLIHIDSSNSLSILLI